MSVPFSYIAPSGVTIPTFAGAYMFNGVRSHGYSNWYIPIFSTITYYINYGLSDVDDGYIVLPGFKITVYDHDNFGGNVNTYDNTPGTKIKYFASARVNLGGSCRLYYNNSEIISIYE